MTILANVEYSDDLFSYHIWLVLTLWMLSLIWINNGLSLNLRQPFRSFWLLMPGKVWVTSVKYPDAVHENLLWHHHTTEWNKTLYRMISFLKNEDALYWRIQYWTHIMPCCTPIYLLISYFEIIVQSPKSYSL